MHFSRVEDFTGANADDFSINDNAIDIFVNEAAELIRVVRNILNLVSMKIM